MKQKDIWSALNRGLDAAQRVKNAFDRSGLGKTKKYPVSQASVEQPGAVDAQVGPLLYGATTWKSLRGIFKIIGGGALALTGMGFGLMAMLYGPLLVFGLAALGGGSWLLGIGIGDLARVKRFGIYRGLLGDKTSIPLTRLCQAVQKNDKFLRRDLGRMFRQGYFLEGHLDHEETMLITSHETYREFEEHRLLLEQQRQTALEEKPPEKPAPPSEIQAILDRGEAFVQELRRCNDRIPGEEVSAKISRMELLVDSIFDRLEAHPEVAPDLQRLLDYYLPLSVKLLKAYADMDDQPVQGETITASKKEIEGTLDTLNAAFEKLLDQVFQDTALDLSSDITVLNTMLAQEGLAEDELDKLRKNSR